MSSEVESLLDSVLKLPIGDYGFTVAEEIESAADRSHENERVAQEIREYAENRELKL